MSKSNEVDPQPEIVLEGFDYNGYCVKCKEKRDVTGDVTRSPKNGSQIAKGACPVCGTTVCRILGKNWVAPE